jgi:sortase (surface protein transpeptidase)
VNRIAAAAALVVGLCLAGCASSHDSVALPPTPTAVAVQSAADAVTNAPKPLHVRIPALHVAADIVPVGLNSSGAMVVPPVAVVGWYDLGPAPGELGPAVLAGHVNYDGVAGTFANIGDLRPGDTVTVTDDAGTDRTWRVYDVLQFPKTAFDTAAVFGDTAGPELRLVTCSGHVVDHSYLDNTVVRARPV